MPSFVAISSENALSEQEIARYQEAALRRALYVPASVKTYLHSSHRALVIELCAFEPSSVATGPDESVETLHLFEGNAWTMNSHRYLRTEDLADDATDPQDINGSFFWLRVDQRGVIAVDFDPLLSIPLFCATKGSISVISDRMSACAAIVEASEFDQMFSSWISSIGFAVGENTPYTQVRRATVGSSIRAVKGALSFTQSTDLWGHRDHLPLAERITRYKQGAVKALELAMAGQRLRVGLTGGKDSRLLLALLMEADLHHKVDFFVFDYASDKGGTADAIVARNICERFGINIEIQPRTAATAEAPSFDTLLTNLRKHTFVSDGLAGGWDRVSSAKQPSKQISIIGLYGEVLKHFFKGSAPVAEEYSLETTILTYDPFGAFKEETKQKLSDHLEGQMKFFSPPKANSRDISDVFYCTQRLPNWAAYHNSCQRFWRRGIAPLYNREILSLPFCVPYTDRRDTWLHFEIINQISPDLAGMAFALDKWSPRFCDSPDPVKNPEGIPKHGGWQHAVVRSDELRKQIAEFVRSGSGSWTSLISKDVVAGKVENGDLAMQQTIGLLGIMVAEIFEKETLTGPKARFANA